MITTAPAPAFARQDIPPEDLYWALLDPPEGHSGRGHRRVYGARRRRELGYLFESTLPVPIESVHARFAPLGDGRVLACGISHDRLDSLPHGAIRLVPDQIPGFILSELTKGEAAVPDIGSLNLLTGAFTPQPVKRLKQRWIMVVFITMMVCSAFLVAGFERRRMAYAAGIEQDRQESMALYSEALGPISPSGQHPAAQLLAELRSLRQRTSRSAVRDAPVDASLFLAALLEAWPDGIEAYTQSLQVRQDAIRLSVRLNDPDAAEKLESSLSSLAGWAPGQRSLRRTRDGLILQLPLTRAPEAQP